VLGVLSSFKENLPAPGSGHGFNPQEYVLPLVLMLCGGGRTLEDIRESWSDVGLRELRGFSRLSGADALGEWLRRGQVAGLKRTNGFFARQLIVRSDKNDFTLDVDATMNHTQGRCAAVTVLGRRAFQAPLSFFAELDVCVACDFRQGSVAPGEGVRR
jgi:hypothetical protein